MSLLELRDLHITYRSERGDVPAVRGVNLTIDPGETVGLAGESGCGKSTIAGAVLRLLPKETEVTGQILLDGEDVYDMNPGRLRAVRWTSAAIVFQGALHALNPVQRVGNQIAEAIRLHSSNSKQAADDRVRELLERVGLPPDRARSYPHQLSGGQRQRVLIALALACEPKLLIADEPTTALDVMVQAQVLELLAELQRDRGLGLLFITHDLSVLTSTCERLAVMYAGRIVEDGPSHDVFGTPEHPVLGGVGEGIPHDRRPGLTDEAERARRRSAQPDQPADRMSVPSTLRQGGSRLLRFRCRTPAGHHRQARRVHPRPDHEWCRR